LESSVCLQFENNHLVADLFGQHNEYLEHIAKQLDVQTSSRGSKVALSGQQENVDHAQAVLTALYERLEKGLMISSSDVDATIRKLGAKVKKDLPDGVLLEEEVIIKTKKRLITPYTPGQQQYIKMLYDKELVFAQGPAGTGKTYLAVAVAVAMYLSHKVERIILARPAVEAGEKIGFLPGDMKEKVDPYMQPLYDALHDMLPSEKVQKNLDQRIFEIAPLAFMRGRTLKNAFVILDEAQNATPVQMKMFLTRLGEGSRMVINGDISQIDLPPNIDSGMKEAMNKLASVDEIGQIKFDEKDVVRHSLVAKIIQAYDNQ